MPVIAASASTLRIFPDVAESFGFGTFIFRGEIFRGEIFRGEIFPGEGEEQLDRFAHEIVPAVREKLAR
jgi:hypothetical protein